MPSISALFVALAFVLQSGVAHAERLKTVVVGIQARRGVDKDLAAAMTDVVQGEYAMDRSRKVLGRSDIERLMQFESDKQALGCVDDSCLAEIASALDVQRLVTGSMDKIGSSYFVVLTEIDATTVDPVARVQGRVPLEEDRLLFAFSDMAKRLLNKAAHMPASSPQNAPEDSHWVATGNNDAPPPPNTASRPPHTPQAPPAQVAPLNVAPPDMQRGLFVASSPSGVAVEVDGKSVGATPVSLDALPAGEHDLVLTHPSSTPIRTKITTYEEGVTQVSGDFQAPIRIAQETESAASSRTWIGIAALAGGATTGCLIPLGGVGVGVNGATQVASTVICVGCVGGAGLMGWGLYDLFTPPSPPNGRKNVEVNISVPGDQQPPAHLSFDPANGAMAN